MTSSTGPATSERARRLVPYLKERVYVSFISLAVLLALGAHPADTTAATAFGALLVAAIGAGLAGLVSEIIAHLAVHEHLPSRAETGHLVRISAGALATVALPAAALLLSLAGVLTIGVALNVAVAVLALTLGAVGFLAVVRSRLPWFTKLGVFFVLFVLGVIVIAVQLLAHG
jgi:hypothetical protein